MPDFETAVLSRFKTGPILEAVLSSAVKRGCFNNGSPILTRKRYKRIARSGAKRRIHPDSESKSAFIFIYKGCSTTRLV
jgi:hypothetical protein